MENRFEQPENEKERTPLLERDPVKTFVYKRNIATEDLYLIEALAAFPKNLFITEFHNLFNMNKDRSGQVLETLIEISRDEAQIALFKIALEFYRKYDWATSWNLVRVLEDI